MWLCPVCKQKFIEEAKLTKHFLKCWKEHNPYHESISVPHNEDVTREVSNEMQEFFYALQERKMSCD